MVKKKRTYPPNDTGAVTLDWLALTAGILLLGILVVYAIFTGGVSNLVCQVQKELNKNETAICYSRGSGNYFIRASRFFIEPHDFPPRSFAAYGIIAFKASATPETLDRWTMICNAYMGTLLPSKEVAKVVSVDQQMVTVWPVRAKEIANFLNLVDTDYRCPLAVEQYDLSTSLHAIRDAEKTGGSFPGVGPYLLAWAPSDKKGASDTLVLSIDLSSVTVEAHAVEIFESWREEIEEDPSLWSDGFTVGGLKRKVKLWLDRHGSDLLTFFVGDKK